MDVVVNGRSICNNYTFDAHLALAFQEDCEEFLNAFKNLSTFKFSKFAQLWKSRQFIGIFNKLDSVVILQRFLDNCFLIIKKFLFVDNIYKQAGCLYMLYALYYKQPLDKWIKIRVTIKEYSKLLEILTTFKINEIYEPVFVANKMVAENAFSHCGFAEKAGLHSSYLKRLDLFGRDVSQQPKAVAECPIRNYQKLLHEDEDFRVLVEYEELYRQAVNKYAKKTRRFSPFPPTVLDTVRDLLKEPEKKDSEIEHIRQKVMKNNMAVYRGERHVVTALNVNQPSTSKTKDS